MENDENLELDFIDGCFLTNKTKFEYAHIIENEVNLKIGDLVKLPKQSKYCGMIYCLFKLNGESYAGVKSGKDNDNPAVMEFKIFVKDFKGFVVKYECIKKMEKNISLKSNSKIIDDSKSLFIVEIDKEKNEFVSIKGELSKTSDGEFVSPVYGKIVRRVQINTVDCVQITQIVPYSNELVYVKVADVEIIENIQNVIKYHNQVIIIPDSILEIEPAETKFKIDNLVTFEDSNECHYQGKIHWAGKVNQKKAAIIILSSPNDDLDQYKISRDFRDKNLFQDERRGIFAGQFALKRDAISYITCTKTKLEVLDPKYKYPFQREDHIEKMLIFKYANLVYAVILKWKGFIYNQCCIGCEMKCESDQGTDGKYGNEQLFQCPAKKGIVLSADKVNSDSIHDICEFGTHKELQLIQTKYGYKVYDINFLCCIEKTDNIAENRELKIGCKIEFDHKVVGICNFLGKVNGKSTVGVKMKNTEINGNSSILDHIRAYSFKSDKNDFMDSNDVTVGSYYTTWNSDDHSYKINSSCYYFPDNNRNSSPLTGSLKWIGKYEDDTTVCGVSLDNECPVGQNQYFLEPNLFQHEEKHGIIVDIYKIECIDQYSSMESNFPAQESLQQPNKNKLVDILFVNLLKERSDMDVLNICQELHSAYDDKKLSEFLKKSMNQVKIADRSHVLEWLLDKENITTINDIIMSYENMNLLFPNLFDLLCKCIDKEHYSIIENILSKLDTNQTEINFDSVCLQLGVKCLQNINSGNMDDRIKLFQSLVGKCIDKNRVFGDSENAQETFLTHIILDELVSVEIVNNVLESRLFDINGKNSDGHSPLELAIRHCKPEVLDKLFSLNCDKQRLLEFSNNLKDDCAIDYENRCKTLTLIMHNLEQNNQQISKLMS